MLCSERGAVWESWRGGKAKLRRDIIFLFSSVRRGAINTLVSLTHLLVGGGAAYFGGLPSGENCHPISELFCGAVPVVFMGSPAYFERYSVSLPASPLTFSGFLGWAIPEAIGNLLSGIYLTEAADGVT